MYGRRTKIIIVLLTILSAKIFLLTSCVRCPPNQPPIAVLKANPLSGTAPLDVIFDISGSSDPDGIIISYSLDFGDGTSPATGTDVAKPITHTYTAIGSFTAILSVTDNRGATGKDSLVITVGLANRPPTANPQSVTTEEDAPLTITLTGSDPDGDPLTFNIVTPPTNGSLSAIAQLSPTSAQVTYSPNANFYGSDSFTFKVNDGALDSSPATVSISITPVNDVPIAVISSPADSSAFTQGQAITFQGSANDVEDGPLTGAALVWISNVDGQIGTGESFTRNDLSVGTHTITLTATDSQGATGTDSITMTIIAPPNQSPVAVIEASPTSGVAPLDVTFNISGSYDPDGTIVGFELDFGDGTEPAKGTNITKPITHTYSAVGTFNAFLTVTDNRGARGTDSVVITVTAPPPNRPPTAKIFSPADGSSFLQGDAITFKGSATDPEDGILTGASLVWSSSIDGQIGTGESFTRNDLSVGTHTITLTATDSKGAKGTDSVTITVRAFVGRTWYVDDDFRDCPNADFNRIQDAINAASPGDTIMVCPGTYVECLVIEKSLTLKGTGRGKSVVQAVGYGWPPYFWPPPLKIVGETEIEVIVEDLTFTRGWHGAGVLITGRARATIQNNEIIDNDAGMIVRDFAQAIIVGNVIQGGDVGRWGIWVGGSAVATIRDNVILDVYWDGILLEDSSYGTIIGNMISENFSGVTVTDNAYADIRENNISNNAPYGIYLLGFAQAMIYGNTISGQERGIVMGDSTWATIQNNNISGRIDRGWVLGAAGIVMEETAQAIIQGNTIAEFKAFSSPWWPQGIGIAMSGSTQADIQENRILNSDCFGVALNQPPCYYPYYYEELFKGAVRGRKNVISGNKKGEVCPSPELNFLMTEEGGCYGPKC